MPESRRCESCGGPSCVTVVFQDGKSFEVCGSCSSLAKETKLVLPR